VLDHNQYKKETLRRQPQSPEDSNHKTSNFTPHRRAAGTTEREQLLGESVRNSRPLPLDLNCLLSGDIPKIWSHIEFDLCGVCVVRQHDGRIAYAASAKLHFLFCLDFTVFDEC